MKVPVDGVGAALPGEEGGGGGGLRCRAEDAVDAVGVAGLEVGDPVGGAFGREDLLGEPVDLDGGPPVGQRAGGGRYAGDGRRG